MTKKWTKKEIELLKKDYPTKPKEELESLFNRNMAAITFKANSLNLKRQQYWTKKEEELLMKYYSTVSEEELATLLNRSIASIRNKASRLNIRKNENKPKAKPWSQNEIKKLKEIYPTTSQEELTEIFNRSINAIRNKAFQLNIKRKKR
ncbi:hypothetical protein [Natranaerofaba carboxydovora]|uniref:hypothetical protein n=1 Tax=Natranaerofaba carboxydovora TaxID=2742683 RepID=UPI001F1304F5|nr:hypothetical protein [Natranaerofaba carboxydovora]UMZ75256.1 hypothetical protein ACONDI_02875 [Natranaerofaba carboxydovora]